MAGTHALGGHVTAQTVTAVVTAAVAEVVDSVLATIYVPNSCTILDVILTSTDLDTGGTAIELDVGDSSGPATSDDDRFIAAFAASGVLTERAAATAPLYSYAHVKDTSDDQVEQAIECTIKTVATTGQLGSITMTVIYVATQ
jgi:hypothetical protein